MAHILNVLTDLEKGAVDDKATVLYAGHKIELFRARQYGHTVLIWAVDGKQTTRADIVARFSGARAEAIAEADAHVTNCGLPSYSDLLAFVQGVGSSPHLRAGDRGVSDVATRARRLLGAQS